MAKILLANLKELFSPFFALKDHAHGLITKDGIISGQASKNVVTDSNGKITTEAKPTIPSANATATNIKMNGTQSAGSLTTFAKADHVHPVDTSRAAASHTHDDRYYTETEVNTKLSDYLTTDDASATYQPKGSYLTSHNPVDTALSSTSTNAVQNKVINTALSGKANSSHTHHDTDIDWNGSALAGMVSPVDMAMYREFNANRLAYLDGDNITIEYSTNGGSTWTAMGTATEKLKLVTTVSNFKAGNGSTTDYSKNQVRVTIKMGDVGVNSSIYMTTRKIMLYLCTCGASGTKCQISTSTYKAPTTFTNVGNAVGVSGYSGWNSIPLNVMLGGYANQVGSSSDRIQNLRLTFTQTGGTGNLGIQKIRLFGETAWAVPSNMASEGDLYSYDENQNATFSNKITSTGFVKSGGTSSQFLKADGSVDSNNYIKTSSTSGYIKNDGTVGTPTNTTYSADNSTLQLSSTTFSVKDGGITNAKLADKSSLITEYIVGTQTSSTSAWTGKATKITSLAAGQVIYYKLPYASTSTAVTLNLTLADNSTTGAKEVWFWNGGRMTTQYGVNSIIGLIYNGSQWWAINPSSNNNNDYLRIATRIVSGETNQIPANRIIGGVSDSNGVGKYYIVTSEKVLDVRYPILFNNSAINSGGYTDNVYISHTGVPLVNNVSGKTVTSQRQVYIEGTAYSNNKLTVSSNVFVSDDNLTNGYYYLYIGVSYSTTHIRFNTMNQIVYKKTSNGLIPVGQSYNDLTDKPTSMTPTAHTDSNGAYGKATTSVWGHTKLSSATNSTDETMSATPKAVKAAYDLANGKPSLGTTATTAAKGDHTHTADTIDMVDNDSNIIQYYGVMDVQSMLDALHSDKPSYEDLDSYSLNGHSHSYNSITNKPSYTATVTSSTSGAYKIGSINISGSNVDIYGKDTNTTYTHPNSGVTAGTNYNSNQTPSFGGTFNIPKLTFNAQGHITASANSTVKIPALPTSSTSQAGIIQIGTGELNAAAGNHTHSGYASSTHTHDDRYFTESEINTKLGDYLTESDAANTYLTSHNPIDTALSSTSTNAVQNKVVNTALSGKVAVSQGTGNSGKFLKVNSSGNVACESVTIPSAYTHPSYTARTGVPTANTTIGSAGTFTVSQPVSDATGHITALNTRTYTLPTASTSQKGIIQIGTGASNAAAGNHTHYAEDIAFTANSDDWQLLEEPTDVDSAINVIFDYFEENKANTNHTHSGWVQITTGPETGSGWGWILYANKDIKMANFTWVGTTNSSGTKELGTIPSPYTPVHRQTAPCSLGFSEFVRVDPDGKIYAKLDSGTSNISCNTYWRYE